MLVRSLTPALLALVGLAATPIACSSASVVSSDVDGGSDASVVDAGPERPDPTLDAGVEVPSPITEKPSPVCHDVPQRGEPVLTVPTPDRAPSDKPIETITPGFYTVVSKIEYVAPEPIENEAPARYTVYVSPTRIYTLIDAELGTQKVRSASTQKWALRGGRLERTYVCSSDGLTGETSSLRIDASGNGFTVYGPGQQTVRGSIALRYVRVAD